MFLRRHQQRLFTLLTLLFFFIAGCHGFHYKSLYSNETVYEILESYGFPAGLLPETVKGYDLEDGGSFALDLDGSCSVSIPDAYPVKYASEISGNIASGSLSNLSGISVKVLFIWWNIDAISVSGSDLVFRVGPATAIYPISNFSENPVCDGAAQTGVPKSSLQLMRPTGSFSMRRSGFAVCAFLAPLLFNAYEALLKKWHRGSTCFVIAWSSSPWHPQQNILSVRGSADVKKGLSECLRTLPLVLAMVH